MIDKIALDKGFVDTCNKYGVFNPMQIMGLMKLANESINEYIQKRINSK